MGLKPPQHKRVLAMLERAGHAGVCSIEFYRGDEWGPLPNARNRIWERVEANGLVAQGYHVESFPCPDAHGSPYFRYVLLHGPDRYCGKCRPGQMTLQEAM